MGDERRQTRQQCARKWRLYRATRAAVAARDRVLAVVAHDVRNPLQVIRLQVKLMEHGGRLDERAAQGLLAIERASQRIDRLVRDLLDITRIESGKLSLARSTLSPAKLVLDAVEAQRGLAMEEDVIIDIDIDHDLPTIHADHDRMLQVFENLIGNAVKFSAPGGHIVVAAKPVDGAILFSVTDDGEGISDDDLHHIFEGFWQGTDSDRRGAGLGLQIVKGIVDAHGGRIWAESRVGVGTTLFFIVPAPPAAGELVARHA